jgi:hypothetical protein
MGKYPIIGNGKMFTRNSIRNGFCILLCLLAFTPWRTHAQSKEYQIKAAFLFNFAQFVDWPTTAFTNTEAQFCIGILGDDPFGTVLDEMVQGEKVNGHPLVIQRYLNVQDVKDCQILFICRSESEQTEQIVAGLKGKNILTVSDIEGFTKSGGIIQFTTEQNKIHLRISMEAAKNANLTISSKLLRLAEIVEPGKD